LVLHFEPAVLHIETFDWAKKFICVNRGSVLWESVLTEFYCTGWPKNGTIFCKP